MGEGKALTGAGNQGEPWLVKGSSILQRRRRRERGKQEEAVALANVVTL